MVKKTAPLPEDPAAQVAGTVEADPNSPIPGTVEAIIPPVDPFAHLGDEHWGKGGCYVVGADGKRAPAPETPVTNKLEADHG